MRRFTWLAGRPGGDHGEAGVGWPSSRTDSMASDVPDWLAWSISAKQLPSSICLSWLTACPVAVDPSNITLPALILLPCSASAPAGSIGVMTVLLMRQAQQGRVGTAGGATRI